MRTADWLNRLFLKYKITNFPNNRTTSSDIFTLFTCYVYFTLCGWIIKTLKQKDFLFDFENKVHLGPRMIQRYFKGSTESITMRKVQEISSSN